MRRFIPWALLLLIGLGAGLGAAFGAAESPGTAGSTVLTGPAAQRWLTGVLAATKAAGTAHLHSSEVTTSTNPDLRGWASGSGVIDFTTGSFHVSDADHEVQWTSENGGPSHRSSVTDIDSEIAVGPTLYDNFGTGKSSDNTDDWTADPGGPRKGDLGLASADGFGATVATLTGSVKAVGVRALGPTVVSGAPATRYLVQTEVQTPCRGSKAPIATTTVWVDGRGRMVQARFAFFFSGKFPASLFHAVPGLTPPPLGPRTYTATLRLSALGAPVRVSAPNLAASREHAVAELPIRGSVTVTGGPTCG